MYYIFASKLALQQKVSLTVRRIPEKWTVNDQIEPWS